MGEVVRQILDDEKDARAQDSADNGDKGDIRHLLLCEPKSLRSARCHHEREEKGDDHRRAEAGNLKVADVNQLGMHRLGVYRLANITPGTDQLELLNHRVDFFRVSLGIAKSGLDFTHRQAGVHICETVNGCTLPGFTSDFPNSDFA